MSKGLKIGRGSYLNRRPEELHQKKDDSCDPSCNGSYIDFDVKRELDFHDLWSSRSRRAVTLKDCGKTSRSNGSAAVGGNRLQPEFRADYAGWKQVGIPKRMQFLKMTAALGGLPTDDCSWSPLYPKQAVYSSVPILCHLKSRESTLATAFGGRHDR